MFSFVYPDLPILARRDDIVAAVRASPAVVVQGGTGSGKTTQLPKFLLEAGFAEQGLIGLTQPRRIAALSIADRLRQETGRPELIGAKIRFHEDVPPGARVKVMTDGILLQEFRRDPLLRRYACVILDEAHERSLNVDILLGIFKTLLPRRPDFRLVVASATLDAERFAAFLGSGSGVTQGLPGSAPVVEVEGRQYPVAVEYWDPAGGSDDDDEDAETPSRAFPPVEAAAMAIRDLQKRAPDNLLAFLPTEKEINELHRELERDLGKHFLILPLYSRLGPSDQKKVFQESQKPKIILATNIAETSLTIPGIGYVVDTGLARISRYHPQTKIQGLPIERISQASARQRCGRAGRVKPGVCVRLYSEADFNERQAFTEPEILRSNLANVVLHLLALDLPVETFPFPDPPAPAALKGAFRQLHELGAVDGPGTDARLTPEGLRLSRLPVDVALGKILLKAGELGVLQSAMIIAAGLTVSDPRFTPHEEPERGQAVGLHRRFENPNSDFLGLLALWAWIHRNGGDGFSQRKLRHLCGENFLSYNRVREWMDLVEQFARILQVTVDYSSLALEKVDPDALHKAILAGFLPFMARKKPEDVSYRLAGDKEAFIHPGSALGKRKPEWIVAGEVRQTSRTFIFRAAEIKPAWVEELAPEACKRSYHQVAWNPDRGFVEAVEKVSYKGFALRQDKRVNYESVAPEECAEIFWREGVIRDGRGAAHPGGETFPFRARNQKALETLAALENKVRARGLVPDEDALAHWYRERAPEVTSRLRLEKFLREAGDQALEFTPETWAGSLAGDWEAWLPEARGKGRALEQLFPDTIELGDLRYRASYGFDFGNPLDGISLEIPLRQLGDLSLPALMRGLPGWRKWIWDWCLERLPVKSRQAASENQGALAKAWAGAAEDIAPAANLMGLLAASEWLRQTAPGTGALALPATWPAHLQIHVFVPSPSGRRFLMHVDPACGSAELFAAAARLVYGEAQLQSRAGARQPWENWAHGAWQNHGCLPPPLAWKDRYFAPDSFSVLRGAGDRGGSPSAACGFFLDGDEAAFQAHVGARLARPQPPIDPKAAAFFAKRCQVLFEAWGVPEKHRQETSRLRSLVCDVILPCLFIEARGGWDPAQAEKDLPPCRAAAPKPGTQVKSLSALGQAAARGGDGTWVGAALTLAASLVSYGVFLRWYRCFAQPPPHSKDMLRELLAALPEGKAEELWASPFHAAWAAKALAARLPELPEGLDRNASSYIGILPDGDLDELLRRWNGARAKAESLRKNSKAVRDSLCARLVARGQSVAGLPGDLRAALEILDQPAPMAAGAASGAGLSEKFRAELELTLHANRVEGRAGVTGAQAAGAENPAGKELRNRLIQDLGSRFKKL